MSVQEGIHSNAGPPVDWSNESLLYQGKQTHRTYPKSQVENTT